MKYIRYKGPEGIRFGILEKETVKELSGSFLKNGVTTGKELRLCEVKLLAPLIPQT